MTGIIDIMPLHSSSLCVADKVPTPHAKVIGNTGSKQLDRRDYLVCLDCGAQKIILYGDESVPAINPGRWPIAFGHLEWSGHFPVNIIADRFTFSARLPCAIAGPVSEVELEE